MTNIDVVSHKKGDITEAIAIAELKARNIPVSIPFGDNERYDLILESPRGILLRVQVKTGRYVDGAIRFSGQSQSTNSQGSTYRSYVDIDYFMVYCHELNSFFLIPSSEVNTTKTLRVDPPQLAHPRVNWAMDYSFDHRWPPRGGPTSSETELPPQRRGDATEAKVIAELLRRNISIALPSTDNERYDVVAKSPRGTHYRIQIKTGRVTDGRIEFNAISTHANGSGNVYKAYDEEIDHFLVFVPELDELYLIAEDSFNTHIGLRLEEPSQPQWNTKLAEDYEFDRNWPPEAHDDPTPSRRDPENFANSSIILDALQAVAKQVATPVEDAEWTYLVTAESGCHYRLAARTAPFKDGRVFFQPGRPDNGDIDAYLVLCRALDTVYLLTPDDFDTSMTLWVDDPETVRNGTTWAEDFELDRAWPPEPGRSYSRMSPVGIATRSFESIGADVAYPSADDSPYDLLVTSPAGTFRRVAVESGWVWNGRIRLKPDRHVAIDWYLLVCRETDTSYLIAPDEFDRSISLRVEPPIQDHGTTNWASDYELETRWPAVCGTTA